jgi:biotin transport system ATP-binding protein
MAELFRVESLSHTFRNGELGLSDLSFSLMEGDFLVLAGRNGAGKTILMRQLIGLTRLQEGKIFYRDKPAFADLSHLRSRVGLVFQDAQAQIVGQTVEDDVAFGPSNLGLKREEIKKRTEKALRLASLERAAERSPETLSGGERRRLAIAGVLAMEAECLILDEPFANLDLPSIRAVLGTLVDLHAAGKTIIVLTHEIEKVLAHATRLIVLDEGKIAYDGAPDDFPPERFRDHGLQNPYRSHRDRAGLSWLKE